eukprot:Skav208050  [mRNA]  locus=scaffold1124:80188:82671:- [translate_table: standard]
MTRRPWPFPRHVCLVWLACGALGHLSFVLLGTWGDSRAVRQATQRFVQAESRPELPQEDLRALSRRLTARIKNTKSPQELLEVLDEILDGPFDFHQAAFAYDKLGSFLPCRQQDLDVNNPVVTRLHTRVTAMVLQDQLRSHEFASVLHNLTQFYFELGTPTELLAAMARKVEGMNPQALSRSFRACVALRDRLAVRHVLPAIVPAIAAQIPDKAKGMKPRQLSECMRACSTLKKGYRRYLSKVLLLEAVSALAAQIIEKAEHMIPHLLSCFLSCRVLKEFAPDVLEVVPALADQIIDKASGMTPTQLSNCLWTFARLKEFAANDLLRVVTAVAPEIVEKAEDMTSQDLSSTLWASAQLKEAAPDVLVVVPAIAAQIHVKARNMEQRQQDTCIKCAVQLHDVAPDVLNMVVTEVEPGALLRLLESVRPAVLPTIAAQIVQKAKDMDMHQLFICLTKSSQLKDVVPEVLVVVPAVAAQMIHKVGDMDTWEWYNCLAACSQLKDVVPDVLMFVPASVAQIVHKAKDMDVNQLSRCLQTSSRFKDDVPEVLEVVPAIAAQIAQKAQDMEPGEWSTCLWTLVELQQVAPEVLELLPALASQITEKASKNDVDSESIRHRGHPFFVRQLSMIDTLCSSLMALLVLKDSLPQTSLYLAAHKLARAAVTKLKESDDMKPFPQTVPTRLPFLLWASARVRVYDRELLAAIAERFSPPKRSKKMGLLLRESSFDLCALSWSYQVLDTKSDFVKFRKFLESAISKKGLSKADVESFQLELEQRLPFRDTFDPNRPRQFKLDEDPLSALLEAPLNFFGLDPPTGRAESESESESSLDGF